jgi:arsenite methyltransferase
MTQEEKQIREIEIRSEVRRHYGKIAEEFAGENAASCCSPSGSNCGCSPVDESAGVSLTSKIYDTDDVESLPDSVTGLSLGCGDPVTLATLEPGQTVLDLGSGGGIDCFLAAKQVGQAGRVIGVDMTASMIEQARANKARLGVENVEFRLGEIEYLPVGNDEVDVVISNCVINLSPDKAQVFREAYRVLKPGGRIAVSDIVTGGPLPQAIKENLSAWAGCVSGALEAKEYIRIVRDAGFEKVELTPVFWDEELIDEASKQLGLEVVEDRENGSLALAMSLEDGSVAQIDLDGVEGTELNALQQAVFSAKVTARKPG